jgi:hypothetical protein
MENVSHTIGRDVSSPLGGYYFWYFTDGIDAASFTICADGGANRLYALCEKSESHAMKNHVRFIRTPVLML